MQTYGLLSTIKDSDQITQAVEIQQPKRTEPAVQQPANTKTNRVNLEVESELRSQLDNPLTSPLYRTVRLTERFCEETNTQVRISVEDGFKIVTDHLNSDDWELSHIDAPYDLTGNDPHSRFVFKLIGEKADQITEKLREELRVQVQKRITREDKERKEREQRLKRYRELAKQRAEFDELNREFGDGY
ncbi:hypothetical protein C9I98_05720 [Photobacterium sanctipauli]|uniref:Uncharacterized protein n=1 Tax=Photobacterium sanctipauli TaxID=1342794 RepID=A0A2T3NYW7_9GAMM|nr:hypothetical protein [Photobacterium sanctipauli]PSW21430.1 hypothetical protein C9I98_05720 [Photobacterium sanctipauli]